MPLRLLKGIRHFKNNQFKAKEAEFTALSKGQTPDVLFFGCIDSRVDHSLITNAQLGEILVNRNPGNIIPPHSDKPTGEASSSEFALEHLNVAEIIVCGHSHCGAMKGLMTPGVEKVLPNTAAWLNHSKEALVHVEKDYPELEKDPTKKLTCLTQQNVLLQMEHLKTHPAVAKRLAEGTLKIHGWYYEFEKGEIYIYNPDKQAFIAFEETVDEVAQEKLAQIIETEAVNYLTQLTPQNKHFTYLKKFEQQHYASLIWHSIKDQVRKKAIEELRELYLESNGHLNPKLTSLLGNAALIKIPPFKNQYKELEQIFDKAIKYQLNEYHNSEQQTELSIALTELKIHCLKHFDAKKKAFSFNQCLALATQAKDLSLKLKNKTASTADIEQFKTLSKDLKPGNSSVDILLKILTHIAFLALGILVALGLGGGLGAIALGGLVTGSLMALSLFKKPKNPFKEVVNASSEAINKIDEPRNMAYI